MRERYLALWVVAVLTVGVAYASYLALRFETMRLGYELDSTTREYKRLSEAKRMLALETETLRERQRVRAIAERTLGMGFPELARVVTMDGEGGGRAP